MIKPTVGRIVWVVRPGYQIDMKPEVGLVTYVHSDDRYINVAGFDASGYPFRLIELYLAQDDDETPKGNFACWMPYQKGQAAKTEQLEKQVGTSQA